MSPRSNSACYALVGTILTALLLGLLVVAPKPASADDRDLLRFGTANPYLFILLDNSASMNLAIGEDVPLPGYGDHPGSRIYAAKEALWSVLGTVDDLNFGFATFNQDQLGVVAKHWLYYWDGEGSLPPGWPIDFPSADSDGIAEILDVDGDGILTRTTHIDGDIMAVGQHINGRPERFCYPDPADPTESLCENMPEIPGVAGTCDSYLIEVKPNQYEVSRAPLNLDDPTDRLRIDQFPLLHENGDFQTTTLWIQSGDPAQTYRLQVSRPTVKPDGTANARIGEDELRVNLRLDRVSSCIDTNAASFDALWQANLTLRLDPQWPQFLFADRPPGEAPERTANMGAPEAFAGLWTAQDFTNPSICTSGSPFTGLGWEGNYDGEVHVEIDTDPTNDDRDRVCADEILKADCTDLKFNPTQLAEAPLGRPLDRGDVIPFDWRYDNQDEFLWRLAPNCEGVSPAATCVSPDFGIASLLTDAPDAASGLLTPVAGKPIVTGGWETPLGKAVLDFRCWYMGKEGQGGIGKCSEAAFFERGWYEYACTFDPDYGCRRPYLILITDGNDTCAGENPAADTAAMFSHSGIRTWALNLGDPVGCRTGQGLQPITNNGKGECVNIADKLMLRNVLEEILEAIREDPASFTSAAAPTVRTTVDQATYLSTFKPINGVSQWSGHVNGFLRPLPLTNVGTPDFEHENFLWDAGAVLKGQVAVPPLSEISDSKRRVYYSRFAGSGSWATKRRLLDPPPGDPNDAANDPIRYDLWRALGTLPEDTADGAVSDAEEVALEGSVNNVLSLIFGLKTATLLDGSTEEYILADSFHSTPIVVDAPVTTQYFAQDPGADQDKECTAESPENRGYRCFWNRSQRRRRILLVGSNDGLLHAFNAGIFDQETGRYSGGTGHEVFAYAPRTALQPMAALTATDEHQWTVDGSPAVADVFVDPVAGGTFPNPDDRLWRTVAITGFREGGKSYFALDITQPDKLTESSGAFFPEPGNPLGSDGVTPTGESYLPTCLKAEPTGASVDPASCGPNPYPTALWEFFDSTNDQLGLAPQPDPSVGEPPVLMDDDRNQTDNEAEDRLGDLGFTWSNPTLGRIRIREDGKTVDRYVTVFGGGMDPQNKNFNRRGTDPDDPADDPAYPGQGNWLYMVDIETGTVIYKRELIGAAPSEAAAVDTDLDGYLDRIYIGTVAGLMYRVDLLPVRDQLAPPTADLVYPELKSVDAYDVGGTKYEDVKRITVDVNGDPAWEPRMIFDTFDASINRSRPIYLRPAVVFVGKLGAYALAFGTGDREDLWSESSDEGRFYFFVDDTDFFDEAALPFVEGPSSGRSQGFVPIGVDDPALTDASGTIVDLLSTRLLGEKGWYLVLEPGERVTGDPYSLLGVTFFNTYKPESSILDTPGCDPLDPECVLLDGCDDRGYEPDTTNFCGKSGRSRIFLVNALNANPLFQQAGSPSRYTEVSTFVSNPYSEIAGSGSGISASATGDDFLTTEEQALMNSLKQLFPEDCRFTNQRIDIRIVAADTRNERIASIPVCLMPRHWKEFSP